MTPNFRIPRRLALASVCLALTACAAITTTASADPVTRASRTCTPPKYPGEGYFTGKIRVTNIGCAYGKRFVVAYYRCRTRSSPRGRCRSRVRGFRCSERRVSIPTEINGRVTCRRGSQRIVHTYQQNL